jgi:hypothetical protein
MDSGTLYDTTNLIEMCRNEPDPDRQLKILLVINAMLPLTKKFHIPSFLTDDYIPRALHEIDKALKSSYWESIISAMFISSTILSVTPNSKNRPPCYRCNDWNWRGEEKHEASEHIVYCDKCWKKVKGYLLDTA